MPPLTPDALVYDVLVAADPQLSPDGSRLLFTRARSDRAKDRATSQVWLTSNPAAELRPAAPVPEARQLTRQGERNREARWSPDGESIAFVSDRVQGNSTICVMSAYQAGEPRELTRHRPAIGHLAWSPDGRRLAYTVAFDPDNPDEQPAPDVPRVRVTRRLDYKQDNRGYVGDVRTQVFVVDVDSGERRMLTREPSDTWYPQWSPDGQTIAARLSTDNGIYSCLLLIDVADGKTRRVGPPSGTLGVWAWSPDSQRVLFAGDIDPSAQLDFFMFDIGSDDAPRRITTDLQCLPEAGFPTVLPPSQPAWLDDNHVLFHAVRGGESGFYVLELETREVRLERATQALSAGFSTDASKRWIAQAHSSLESTGDIAVYDRRTGQRRMATAFNTALWEGSPLAECERFDVQRNGVTVEAWLLKPPGFDSHQTYPVVLDVHGGPHSYYGYGFNAIQQALAAAGFLVVFSNPRGSGSYGRGFAHMVRNDWGGEDYLDLMAVIDSVLERPYADAARTCIWGYSYGGFMTAWTIGHTHRFKAAVCGAPCFDLESMFGTSDISHAWGPYQWGGRPHEASEAFAAHSPSTYAHKATTATLIMQGEADDRCPIGQGEQMFVALHQAGCEVEFVRYPGGAHTMLRVGPPSHRADFITRLVAWFADHLRETST
jgi:dipeptidyl aminopeptidase/acylaminoacyl peptidase